MPFGFLKPQPQNPNPKPHPQNPLQTLQSHLHSALQTLAHLPFSPPQLAGTPPLACLSAAARRRDLGADERFAGVPVYALTNSAGEFVLVSGRRTGKNLGLFCFRKEDAEALLEEMKNVNVGMREGSKVVELALGKVCQLKVDGVAFRFVPDSSQVANAIREKEKIGEQISDFPGVPVFQSRGLVMLSRNKRYRPFFFRKEDLDDSLSRASRQQRLLNPALRIGGVQVFVLEDIIKSLKERKTSKWDDAVFIPPGLNVSTDISQIAEA